MKHSTTFINQNFRIKVYGRDNEGRKLNKLVGVSGIVALVGVEFLNKFIDRALKAGQDCTTCKLRRGIQVSLYLK